MKRIQKNSGITLIALVITIIVLLILAGISIVTLTGENGILKRANIASEENTKAQIKEEIELAMHDIQMEELSNERTFNMQVIVEKLPGKLTGLSIAQIGDESSGIYSGYEYTITADYQVIIGERSTGPRAVITHTLDTTQQGVFQVVITVNATISEGTIVEMTTPDDVVVENTNQVTYTVNQNGIYVFKAKASNGNITNYSVYINNILVIVPGVPSMMHTVDTEEFGATGVVITVNSIVTEATIVEMTKPDDTVVANTDQVTYLVNRNGTYVFKAKASNGNTAEYTVRISNIRPAQPTIEGEGVHPVLTNQGVRIANGSIVITYDASGNEWINTYSQDNGATWQIYTGPFEPTSSTIKAKSTSRDYPNVYVESQQEIVARNYIGEAAYDGDNETVYTCRSGIVGTTYHLGIDSSVQERTVYVKFTARRYSEWHFTFFDNEGNEVGTWPTVIAPWNEGYQDGNLVVPAGATALQIQYRGGNGGSGDFYEIAVVE